MYLRLLPNNNQGFSVGAHTTIASRDTWSGGGMHSPTCISRGHYLLSSDTEALDSHDSCLTNHAGGVTTCTRACNSVQRSRHACKNVGRHRPLWSLIPMWVVCLDSASVMSAAASANVSIRNSTTQLQIMPYKTSPEDPGAKNALTLHIITHVCVKCSRSQSSTMNTGFCQELHEFQAKESGCETDRPGAKQTDLVRNRQDYTK